MDVSEGGFDPALAGWEPMGFDLMPAGIGTPWRRRVGDTWHYGLQTRPDHANPAGAVHGGILVAFADQQGRLLHLNSAGRRLLGLAPGEDIRALNLVDLHPPAAAEAVHHVTHRRAFGKRLADQPLMRNVIADLALEWEAATLTAFRLAEAFDRANDDPQEKALARILTPIAPAPSSSSDESPGPVLPSA